MSYRSGVGCEVVEVKFGIALVGITSRVIGGAADGNSSGNPSQGAVIGGCRVGGGPPGLSAAGPPLPPPPSSPPSGWLWWPLPAWSAILTWPDGSIPRLRGRDRDRAKETEREKVEIEFHCFVVALS